MAQEGILPMTSSTAISSIKFLCFDFIVVCSGGSNLKKCLHWLRQWLGVEQMISHYLNQWLPWYMMPYTMWQHWASMFRHGLEQKEGNCTSYATNHVMKLHNQFQPLIIMKDKPVQGQQLLIGWHVDLPAEIIIPLRGNILNYISMNQLSDWKEQCLIKLWSPSHLDDQNLGWTS